MPKGKTAFGNEDTWRLSECVCPVCFFQGGLLYCSDEEPYYHEDHSEDWEAVYKNRMNIGFWHETHLKKLVKIK